MTFDAVSFLERLVSGGAESGGSAGGEAAPDAIPPDGNAPDDAGLIEAASGYLVPADLPEPWRELYEERAAIREYDGGQPREHAEAEALAEVMQLMRMRPAGGGGAA